MKLKISINNINTNFKIEQVSIKKLIRLIFREEQKDEGDIGVVFVDHNYMIELNKKFLNKNETTDVLSFPLNDSNSTIVAGEIYINLDSVAEQAAEYNVTFYEEMYRITAHGMLHLMGYDDTTKIQKSHITAREDYYLNLLKENKS